MFSVIFVGLNFVTFPNDVRFIYPHSTIDICYVLLCHILVCTGSFHNSFPNSFGEGHQVLILLIHCVSENSNTKQTDNAELILSCIWFACITIFLIGLCKYDMSTLLGLSINSLFLSYVNNGII